MLIEINNHFTKDGKEYFYWELYDGPDGIDHVSGFATDLIEVFSKIVEWRERIGKDYYDDLTENDETND
jgi:hypothetical protein